MAAAEGRVPALQPGPANRALRRWSKRNGSHAGY
jgi:hypothetical protein